MDAFEFLTHMEATSSRCTKCNFRTESCPTKVVIITLAMPDHGITVADTLGHYFSTPFVVRGKCQSQSSNCGEVDLECLTVVLGEPRFLIISLQRFKVTPSGVEKNENFVDVGRLAHTVDGCYYPLAVVEHLGNTVKQGHFISYVIRENQYYRLSDSREPKKSSFGPANGQIFVFRRFDIIPYGIE